MLDKSRRPSDELVGTSGVMQEVFGLMAQVAESDAAQAVGLYHGIRQRIDATRAYVGCGTCILVCPNGSIAPAHSNEDEKS